MPKHPLLDSDKAKQIAVEFANAVKNRLNLVTSKVTKRYTKLLAAT